MKKVFAVLTFFTLSLIYSLDFCCSQEKKSEPDDPVFSKEYDPYDEMDRIHKDVNRLFDSLYQKYRNYFKKDFFSRDLTFDPAIDVQETENDYIVKADIPGMDKAEISVELKDNLLTISGEKKTYLEEKDEKELFRQERTYGYFSRSITIPKKVKKENIQAEYKNGVLTVILPKEKPATPEKAEVTKINIL